MQPIRTSRFLPLLLGALTSFAPLSIDMYLPGLPAIQRDLVTSDAATGLTLSAFFAGLALAQLIYGPLSDRIGRRPPVRFGMALYALASVGCALAPNIWVLILCRFLQAAGGAAGPVIARAIVRDLHSGKDAASMLSTLLLIMGAAPILAPILGGWMVTHASWRAIFFLLSGLGVLCFGAVKLYLPETASKTKREGEPPLLSRYLSLLRDRRYLSFTLSGVTAQAGMFAYITGSPFVLMKIYAASPHTYSLIFGANALGLIAFSQLNRLLLRRFSSERILGSALLVTVSAALALVSASFIPGAGFEWVVVALFFFVSSLGFIAPNAAALALEEQGHQAGLASAMMGALQFGLAAAGSSLVGLWGVSLLSMSLVMLSCAIIAATAWSTTPKST